VFIESELLELDAAARTQEIARMLGGEKITDKTLSHAEELLAVAGRA
jgi:DNA repair protein RecN (Recombination protein N)